MQKFKAIPKQERSDSQSFIERTLPTSEHVENNVEHSH